MGRQTNLTAPDLADASVESGTRCYTHLYSNEAVLGARDEYAAYAADTAAWIAANPGAIPPGAVEIADAEADAETGVTLGEKIFVKWYFIAADSISAGKKVKVVDRFVQVNATNFPDANIAQLRAALLSLHNARRAALGLV